MPSFHVGEQVKVLRGGESGLAKVMAGCIGVVEEEFLTTANIRFPSENIPDRARLYAGNMAGPYNFSKIDLEKL
jgi:hypothetical protein